MDNFGLTLLILSSILTVTILLIALAAYIIKRTGYRGKLRDKIYQLKSKIFYNMIISYSLQNALKYYMLAFFALNGSDSSIASKVFGGFILTVYIGLPLVFARLLHKMEGKLKKPG